MLCLRSSTEHHAIKKNGKNAERIALKLLCVTTKSKRLVEQGAKTIGAKVSKMQKRRLKSCYDQLDFGDKEQQWVRIVLNRLANCILISSWNGEDLESRIQLKNVDVDEAVSRWCYDYCLTIHNDIGNQGLRLYYDSSFYPEAGFYLLRANRIRGQVVMSRNFVEQFTEKLFEISEPVEPSQKEKLLAQAQELVFKAKRLGEWE